MTQASCAQCNKPIVEPDETFCSWECSAEHIARFLTAHQAMQALGPESMRGRIKGCVLVPPLWAEQQHWFYFIDARKPDTACFGTVGDAARCVADGGWPRAVPDDEGRACEHRVDAIDMWPTKKSR